ncbi:MAG: GIY-YIG nuclease family protein [Desulfobaccales bacterium]
MDGNFKEIVETLHHSYERLLAMAPVKIGDLPSNMAKAGIYLFSEGNHHLYVGRTNRMRQRLNEHARPSSPHNLASFAFRLAREATGRISASYVSDGSRSHLENDPNFKEAFIAEKKRVRSMDVRFVEEADPLKQALLEIYVSVVLRTPHNDFDTH